MSKYDLKTKRNQASVSVFLNTVKDDQKRKDCKALQSIMRRVTGKRAKMWGRSIVGYGTYHYRYKSGQEGDWFLTGFSPRAQNLTVYIMPGFKRYQKQLKKLGKHKLGESCLYIKKLEDMDLEILEQILADSVAQMKKLYDSQ